MKKASILFFSIRFILFILICFIPSEAISELVPLENPKRSSYDATLTLQDCIKIAHEKNPDFLSYYENLYDMRNQRDKYLRTMLPTVTFSEKIQSYIDHDYEQYTSSLNLSQTLFNGGYKYIQYQMSKIDTQDAYLEIQKQSQDLTLEIKKAWYDLRKYIKFLDESESSLERLRQHVSNAEQFYEQGWIWHNDVLQAQVKLAQGRQTLIQAMNDVMLAKAKLNLHLNRDINTPIEPDGKLEYIEYDLDIANTKEIALENRPDYKQTQLDVENSRSSIELAKADLWPSIEMDLDIARTEEDKPLLKNAAETASATIKMDWELWNWGTTYSEIHSKEAQSRQEELKLEYLRNEIFYEVQEALLDAKEADKKVKVLKDALETGQQNYRVTEIRYQERLGTANDLLTAQDLLTKTRKDYVAAVADYFIAIAELENVLGIETDLSDAADAYINGNSPIKIKTSLIKTK